MFNHRISGRGLGLVTFVALSFQCSVLMAGGTSASASHGQVAKEYKAEGLEEFQLADYEQELLECSALSAIHMWVGDNIGEDSGSEVRRALDEDYWLDVSRDYLSLAEEASGGADLSQQVGAEIKAVTIEWRRLTENTAGPEEWNGWFELVDRCETWRPKNASRSYYSKGRELAVNQHAGSRAAVDSK